MAAEMAWIEYFTTLFRAAQFVFASTRLESVS